MDVYMALKNISQAVKRDEEMKNHTSFKIGGRADFMVCPKSAEELRKIIKLAKKENIPYTVVGNGSNLLVSDEGIEGIVIKISDNMSKVEVDGSEIYAEAGVLLSTLSHHAQRNGLSGLEFASGIPGTLGGAAVMNAGAYGGEMRDVITRVGYMDDEGEIFEIDTEDCCFGYRRSIFSEKGKIVLYCRLRLTEGDRSEILKMMNELNARRRDKQPLSMPSAGSTFKRPEGYFAGKLIEDCGLKGFRVGGAEVSTKHSGFVVNAKDATAEDVKKLVEAVQAKVREKFGVELEPEVKFIGRQKE